MLHLLLIPAIEKALGQPAQQVQALVGLAQQKCSAIGTDRASVKTGHDLPLPASLKSEARLLTLSLPKISLFRKSRVALRRLVCRLNRNFEPHLLQPLDVVALHLATLKSVEIVWTEILIAGLVFF